MKKKIVTLMLCLSMGALVLSGCGKKDSKDNSSSSSTSSSSESTSDKSNSSTSDSSTAAIEDDGIPVVDEEDVFKCIELGDYKGLKLEKTVTPVTDQEVEDAIVANYSNTTIEDEPCKEGDTVTISYVGKMDGKEFEGGSTDETYITLGASGYIDGFDDGVIGMKTGETKDLNLTFPDPYQPKAEFSGKPVVFTVTVKSISRPFTELTEDWVKEYTDYSNIEEYRKGVKKDVEDQTAATDENALKSTTWEQIVKDTTVKQYQKSEIEAARTEMEAWITQYAQMMGTDLEGYKEQTGITDEEFEAQLQSGAKSTAKSKMVMKAIVELEELSKDDQEYKDILAKTAKEYKLTEEELIEQNGQEQVDTFIESERVMKLILDSATIKEVPAETEDAGAATSSSSAE